MADQVSSLRSQIKTWERDFKSKFSRDPSVQDIRDQPSVAEKYKLYKKLTKAAAAAATAATSSSHIPQKPVKAQPSIISNPRALQVDPPLPGFNPFSPVKNKGKQRPFSPTSSILPRNRLSSNPFATPSKSTPSTIISPIQVHSHSSKLISSSQLSPLPNTAVSRARKRLGGEPVSPSPNKHKRQRIGSHTLLPFQKLHPSSSDDEHDGAFGATDVNTSFIDDSPIKLPAGGKSFKLLFEDTLPTASVPKRLANVSKAQSRSSDDLVTFHAFNSNDIPSLEASPINPHKDSTHSKRHKGNRKRIADSIPTLTSKLNTKDSPQGQVNQNQSRFGLSRTIAAQKQPSEPKASLKRAFSDVVSVNDGLASATCSQSSLLPPSPTPENASSNCRLPPNAKGKTGTSRKKAKVVGEEDEDDDILDEVVVKVINRAHTAQQVSKNADELDWDPILHRGTHNHDPDARASNGDTSHHETETFNVDLPDELRLMLAISPSRSHNSKEERVFRSLLYGDRVGHYDASRGGDIWDVGEAEEDSCGSTEGEDDWEGAPIPWEVGEL